MNWDDVRTALAIERGGTLSAGARALGIDQTTASRRLARLAGLREAWLAGAGAVPIERHAMLSDGRVMALVAPGARLAWMCAPRVDGPALFA